MLSHKRTSPDPTSLVARRRLARSIDCLIGDARRPVRWRLARKGVVLAAEPSLQAVAVLLRDPDHAIFESAIEEVASLLADGARSPLYGDNPAAAVAASARALVAIERTAAATHARDCVVA